MYNHRTHTLIKYCEVQCQLLALNNASKRLFLLAVFDLGAQGLFAMGSGNSTLFLLLLGC